MDLTTSNKSTAPSRRFAPRTIVEAIDAGLMAELDPPSWSVFCALVRHLPNIRPSRRRLVELTGIPAGSINRHTKRMVDAGLFKRQLRYRDGGGRMPTEYELANITDRETVAEIKRSLRSQKSSVRLDPSITGETYPGAPARFDGRAGAPRSIQEKCAIEAGKVPAACAADTDRGF